MGGGGKGGDTPEVDPRVAKWAQKSRFKPFSFTSSAGVGAGGRGGNFRSSASPSFSNIQQGALAGTQQLLPSLVEGLGRPASEFSFNTDADRLTQDYFNQQSNLLQPAFEQQRQQLQSDLFGSGRMGLQLSGDSVGAVGSGMVQPDAFGLARAQSQTLADVGAQSRERALADAQSRFGLESGVFGINEASQQQSLQNLLGGTQGLFGLGTGVAGLESDLFKNALTAEIARGGADAQAAQILLSQYQAEQAAADSGGGKGLGGSLLGGALGSFGSGAGSSLGKAAGTAIGSYFGGPAGGAVGGQIGGSIG